jgi:hypothetical protein
MPSCRLDPTVKRLTTDGFQFPLGVYPIEALAPKAGYTLTFEAADGDNDSGEWEEWPDRYMFDIVVSAERLEPLCRRLFSILPGRIYPILDLLGRDAFREVDPYISYELLGTDRLLDALRRYRDFFFEDGLCGFGAMCDEPFVYLFVDEHKIVTARVEPEMKERIEKILETFDLEPVQDPAGADAAAHEHRSILLTPPDQPDLLGPDEIVEVLRDEWHMLLNVDPDSNVDDDGHELGMTSWRCIVRCDPSDSSPSRYAEVVLDADRLRIAEEAALDAVEGLADQAGKSPEWDDSVIVAADRLDPETVKEVLAEPIAGAEYPTKSPTTIQKSSRAKGSAASVESSELDGAEPEEDQTDRESEAPPVLHRIRWLEPPDLTPKKD